VFAITQVTKLLAQDPTWGGVFPGMLVLAALWWAWSVYAWLSSAMDVDEGGVRLVMLASMGAMFGAALAVPGAFGDDAVLFGVAYLLVRLFHLVLSATVVRDDPDRRGRFSASHRRRSSAPRCLCSPASSRGTSA
jgi:low temperature requirement protein LtrA